jgi:hypothetical protein
MKMTKVEREVMQMALSALKEALDAIESWGSYASDYFQVKHDLEGDIEKTKKSITALEKCLANDALEKKAENARELGLDYEPEQAQQVEPVACDCDSPAWCTQYKRCNRTMLGLMPYVSPPPRQWVGLTPQERDEINEQVYGAVPHHVAFHAAIEAKLKAKNT